MGDIGIIDKTQEQLQDMVNRLVDTEKKYGMEINIDKSHVMRVSRSNEQLQIKVGNRELKKVDHFKRLEGLLIRVGYCTREIKKTISMAKESFNRKISLLTSKLNIELRKKLVRCYVGVYGSETWTPKKIGSQIFEIGRAHV